jgi:hypothetical protein
MFAHLRQVCMTYTQHFALSFRVAGMLPGERGALSMATRHTWAR